MWLAAIGWLRGLPLRWIAIGVAIAALWATAVVFRIQRDHAREALALATARVAALEAAGRAQNERAALVEQAWQNAAARFAGEATDRVAAIAADRESLAGRLREYAARASRGAVSEASGGAGGNARSVPDGAGVSELDARLDEFARRARRCDAVEAFWQSYARSVGVEVIGSR